MQDKTISAKQLMEQSGIQPAVLKAVIERGAAFEEFAEVYREPDAPQLKIRQFLMHLTDEQQVALGAISQLLPIEQKAGNISSSWCDGKWENRNLFACH